MRYFGLSNMLLNLCWRSVSALFFIDLLKPINVELIDLVLLLGRIHAVTLRYSRGVSSAAMDFAASLCNRRVSELTAHEERAKVLIEWLSGVLGGRKGHRWKNWWGDEVKRDREGRELKGKRWLDEVKGWRTVKDLEDWEKDRKAQGKWRTA